MDEPKMSDSGERRIFETGAVRDRGGFKSRPDLASPHANLREGAWLVKGAEKYGVRNYEKGMPISECVASMARHLESYKLGTQDEDHMAAIRTNAGFILHYEEEIKAGRLSASLDDMPHYSHPLTTLLPPDGPLCELDLQGLIAAGVLPQSALDDLRSGNFVEGPNLEDDLKGLSCKDGTAFAVDAKEFDHAQLLTPFTVYLCGPITGQDVDYVWRDAATAFLHAHGIRTLNPLRGKHPKDVSNQGLSYKGQLAAPEIAERDRIDIEEADVVLAHFPYEPPRQSIGSLMEMGAAAIGFKKTVILCSTIKVFEEHLFCRNFCTLEPNFEQALTRILAIATTKQR